MFLKRSEIIIAIRSEHAINKQIRESYTKQKLIRNRTITAIAQANPKLAKEKLTDPDLPEEVALRKIQQNVELAFW